MTGAQPITLSSVLNISSDKVLEAGTIDVTLNCDTNLFIDPMLMRDSSDEHFANCAYSSFVNRFERIIQLLSASTGAGDCAEHAARRLLSFPEIRYTHLGFSKGKSGAGFGAELTDHLVTSAKAVIRLGLDDPDLFLALALFEDNVGPDRIGDMTTNVVIECLSEFNARVAPKLGLTLRSHLVGGKSLRFPNNPLDRAEPLILVPNDVVRKLPIAADWESIRAAAKASADYKRNVNNFVGEIWAARTKRQKQTVLRRALRSKESFEDLLDLINEAIDDPYDVRADVAGELYPSDLEARFANNFPLDLAKFAGKKLNSGQANQVVAEIIEHFRNLIEECGIWKELWLDDLTTPRLEKAFQRIFFVAASAFCKSNNLDLSPEANGGVGPIDFKISSGADAKVLVEIKRSLNTHLVPGYTSQLAAYRLAESSDCAHYVVIDVGHLTERKVQRLRDAQASSKKLYGRASELWFINGAVQKSASKRK